MPSITASWKRPADSWRSLALCLWLALAVTGLAEAAEIEIRNPQFTAVEDGYAVSADFAMDFNSRLEEAVARGVVLYFVVDFELNRPRWYWLDEKVVNRSQSIRLSYHALTRQYRLSTGALHQSFSSLDEALRMLTHLRNWLVVDKGEKIVDKGPDKTERPLVRPGESYQGALRIRLDITQLPKPFQIAAVGSRDWALASDWKAWPIVVPAESKEAK